MIKFLDLSREIDEIKSEIDKKMDEIIKNSDFIMGSEVDIFEKNFSNYIGTKYCVGVGNGTDALEIAIESLDLPKNSHIITQSNTFISTCSAITRNNFIVDLVDIDDNYQINLDQLELKISKDTRAIIIVHLTGSSCNMDRLVNEIMIRHPNIYLIEDTAQAHGARFNDRRLGQYGILSTFSFYPGKNLGAFGDGGAICTSDSNLYERIRRIRNLGSIKKYQHDILGRNSRLDTIQASILNVKLKYLDQNNMKRRRNAGYYYEYLTDLCKNDVILPRIEENCEPVYHLYIIRVKDGNRDKLKTFLSDRGIETGIHYPECIPEVLNIYSNLMDDAIKAREISKTILSLPMYPNLGKKEIRFICEKIRDFYQIFNKRKELSDIGGLRKICEIDLPGLRFPRIVSIGNKTYLFGSRIFKKNNDIVKYLVYRYEVDPVNNFQVISSDILDFKFLDPDYFKNLYLSTWFRFYYQKNNEYYLMIEFKYNNNNESYYHNNHLFKTKDFMNFEYDSMYNLHDSFLFYDINNILMTSSIEKTNYFWGKYLFQFMDQNSKWRPIFDKCVDYQKDEGHVLHNIHQMQDGSYLILFSIRHRVDGYENYSNNKPYIYRIYCSKTNNFRTFYDTYEVGYQDHDSEFLSYPNLFEINEHYYVICNQDEFGKIKNPVIFTINN